MKITVKYFRCQNCSFVFTEQPYWLEEAYSSVITSLDLGLVSRNVSLVPVAKALARVYFNSDGFFLDYAGGYGMFTRLMRDNGLQFYHQDSYCDNIFARYFDVGSLPRETNFELVTAFEVFEHLENPLVEIGEILKYSPNLLFTTEIVPNSDLESWDYLAPLTGQHVSFYSVKSLLHIANKFGLNFYSNGKNIHLFTNRKLKNLLFLLLTKRRLLYFLSLIVKPKLSLLSGDFQYVLKKLTGSQQVEQSRPDV